MATGSRAVSTPLVKRLHEAGWLKSGDERRAKLRVRRILAVDGWRFFVCLPRALALSIAENPGPMAMPARRITCPALTRWRVRFGERSALATAGHPSAWVHLDRREIRQNAAYCFSRSRVRRWSVTTAHLSRGDGWARSVNGVGNKSAKPILDLSTGDD